MTKKNLVWRLPSKLTLDDIEKMISLKIITAEEAKELTFNTADENEKVKALEEQVEFLKELVERLSTRNSGYGWSYVSGYTPSVATWSPAKLLGTSYTVLSGSNSTSPRIQ